MQHSSQKASGTNFQTLKRLLVQAFRFGRDVRLTCPNSIRDELSQALNPKSSTLNPKS